MSAAIKPTFYVRIWENFLGDRAVLHAGHGDLQLLIHHPIRGFPIYIPIVVPEPISVCYIVMTCEKKCGFSGGRAKMFFDEKQADDYVDKLEGENPILEPDVMKVQINW